MSIVTIEHELNRGWIYGARWNGYKHGSRL